MSWKMFVVVALTMGLPAAARAADPIVPPAVPLDIQVSGDFKPILVTHAVGTQNYICAPVPGGTTVEWLFIGPQATGSLGDVQALTHFLSKNPYEMNKLQATWQHSRDSSIVWAVRRAGSTDPNYVASDAIEWLLLEVTGAGAGPTGGTKLSRSRYIQRVHTEGGLKPPAAECTWATVNTRKFVNYEADYYFYE